MLINRMMYRLLDPNTTEGGDTSGGGNTGPEEVDFAALAEDFESDEPDFEPEELSEEETSETTTDEETAETQEETSAEAETTSTEEQQTTEETQEAATEQTTEQQPTEQQTEQQTQETTTETQETTETSEQQTEPVTAEAIEAAYQQYEANILPQLEQRYALSEEQLAELEENPGQAIPKIAARIHYQAQVAAYTGVMSQMPRIVHTMIVRERSIQQAEERFYSRWPQLREHESHVNATLQTYRRANPKATMQDMIERAGAMAMVSLGLDPRTQEQQQQEQQAAETTTAAAPARPAGTGGSGAARTADRGAVSIWEQMADEIEEEDL